MTGNFILWGHCSSMRFKLITDCSSIFNSSLPGEEGSLWFLLVQDQDNGAGNHAVQQLFTEVFTLAENVLTRRKREVKIRTILRYSHLHGSWRENPFLCGFSACICADLDISQLKAAKGSYPNCLSLQEEKSSYPRSSFHAGKKTLQEFVDQNQTEVHWVTEAARPNFIMLQTLQVKFRIFPDEVQRRWNFRTLTLALLSEL